MVIVYILLGIILIFVASVNAYIRFHPQFGGRITPQELDKYSKSKQWNGKMFTNTASVDMSMGPIKLSKILRQSISNKNVRTPQHKISIAEFDQNEFYKNQTPKYIWYGHSVILLRLSNKNILIDPMFGDDASPIAPFKTKRFSDDTLKIIDSLPSIDILCMSHDHYDHLDHASICKLKAKTKHFCVALGVKKHLVKWGVDDYKITEFDWDMELMVDDIKLIFTETQHFSGRGLKDRFKCLWGGWIIKGDSKNVYWSGDSGYGKHFKTIGEKYGPFDIGFMECGQYNDNWPDVHMTPEESVQAAIDARVDIALPVHNNGFALAMHGHDDPYTRFKSESDSKAQNMIYPKLGSIVEI